jgi:hypothetical protein
MTKTTKWVPNKIVCQTEYQIKPSGSLLPLIKSHSILMNTYMVTFEYIYDKKKVGKQVTALLYSIVLSVPCH